MINISAIMSRTFLDFQRSRRIQVNKDIMERRNLGPIYMPDKQLRIARYEKMRALIRKQTDKSDLEKFKNATEECIIEDEENEKQMLQFFDTFNLLSSGGFDYYHISPIVEMLEEKDSIVGLPSTDVVFINREQLAKLKQVIDCVPTLEFIAYKEEGAKHNWATKYAIWNVCTNNRIDLVPFKRKSRGIEIISDDEECEKEAVLYASEGEHNEIPYKLISLEEKENSKPENVWVRKLVKQKED